MDYQPGDVANGHVLGSDGAWHALSAGPVPTQFVTMRLDPNNYWARWLRRWVFTWLVTSSVFLLPALLRGGPGIIEAVLMFGICLPIGTVLNFAVAAVPTRQARERHPAE